jgi:hypothetical protein
VLSRPSLSEPSLITVAAFALSGDFVRGKNLAILGQLLDRGVKVALMYGDRDYQCNCKILSYCFPVLLK